MGEDKNSLIVPELRRAEQTTDWYARSRIARSFVTMIPTFGGAIDLLLSGGAGERSQKRIDDFIEVVGARLRELGDRVAEAPNAEELVDLTRLVLTRVANTRSQEKRQRFAHIIVHQAIVAAPIEQADAAADLLETLSDLDVAVMTLALTKPHNRLSSGVAIVCLTRRRVDEPATEKQRYLADDFPDFPPEQLLLSCAKLVATGLFLDEGINRLSIGPLELFTPTDLARWFSTWICDEGQPTT